MKKPFTGVNLIKRFVYNYLRLLRIRIRIVRISARTKSFKPAKKNIRLNRAIDYMRIK